MRKTLVVLVVIWTSSAWGWWPPGHGILTRAALLSLPEEMPAFFRQGRRTAVSAAFEPDVLRGTKIPARSTHIRRSDAPEHYINLERFRGQEIPAGRYEYIQLCSEMGIQPNHAGFLPFALAEWTERLAAAFAMHRRWPDNDLVKLRCLTFAGYLGHYSQDACQPLHLTVDHHGRTQPDGTVVPASIHLRVDGMIQFLKLSPEELAKRQEIRALKNLMPAILEQIESGSALVDTLYNMHSGFPDLVEVPGASYTDLDPAWRNVPEVEHFITIRAREATRFTAALYLTAWRISEKMALPDWLDLDKTDVN